MTDATGLRKRVFDSIAEGNTRLLREVLSDDRRMTHSRLEAETQISRSTLQRWEMCWGAVPADGRFRTTKTGQKYDRYIAVHTDRIKRRLRGLGEKELRVLIKLA